MSDAVPATKRAQWRKWAEQEFGQDQSAVNRATDAVLSALIEGYSVSDAMTIARSAAAASASPDTVPVAETQPANIVSDSNYLRGCISSFRSRNELMGSRYGSVWNFRVESWDATGAPQPPIAVEMRGLSFSGSVGDGDWVEIPGRWSPGENLHVKSLRNLSMNAPVEAHGEGEAGRFFSPIAKAIVVLLMLALFAFVAYWILHDSGSTPVPRPLK
jgi:hypothetical protein